MGPLLNSGSYVNVTIVELARFFLAEEESLNSQILQDTGEIS